MRGLLSGNNELPGAGCCAGREYRVQLLCGLAVGAFHDSSTAFSDLLVSASTGGNACDGSCDVKRVAMAA